MALALYRKYRPSTFAEVVGQEHVTEPLRTALAAGRINHAYLFSGPRGCGKTSSARIMARSLNCESGPTSDPCGECGPCKALAPEGPGSVDVSELDAASHGGVDDARELRDRAFYAPAESRYRVFIIDEAHMVTTQGFNALLKIVEEPPEHLIFIFATTEPDKVLTTIRSRTHHYPFRLIPPTAMRELLERNVAAEGINVEPAVYPLVVRAGGGSARDTQSVLDQLLAGAGPEGITYDRAAALLGVTDAALIDAMVDALAREDHKEVYGTIDRLAEAGHDPRRFASDLLDRFRDLILLSSVPDAASNGMVAAPEEELSRMSAQAERVESGTLTRYAELLHNGLREMRGATAPRLLLELLAARMLLPEVADDAGATLQRLERLERRMTAGGGPAPAVGTAPAAEIKPERTFERPSQRAQQAESTASAEPPPPADAPPPAEAPRTGAEVPAPTDAPASTPTPAAADTPAVTDAPASTSEQAESEAAPRQSSAPESQVASAGSDHGGAATQPETASQAAPAQPESAHRSGASAPAQPEPAGQAASTGQDASTGQAASTGQDASTGQAASTGQDASTEQLESTEQEAPAGQPGQIDAAALRQYWPQLLSTVRKASRSTEAMLTNATVHSVEGNGVTLTHTAEPLARRLSEPRNVDCIAAALGELLGGQWQVRCLHAGAAGAPPASSAAPAQGAQAGQVAQSAAGSSSATATTATTATTGDAQSTGSETRASAGQEQAAPEQSASQERPQQNGERPGGAGPRVTTAEPDIPLPPEPDDEYGGPEPPKAEPSTPAPPGATQPQSAGNGAAQAGYPAAASDDPEDVAQRLLSDHLGARPID